MRRTPGIRRLKTHSTSACWPTNDRLAAPTEALIVEDLAHMPFGVRGHASLGELIWPTVAELLD